MTNNINPKAFLCTRMNVQLEHNDKKEAILLSTLDLIGENGFHGSPMSLIAKNAGVAAGTIYHYFPSKEHLIFELYEHIASLIKEAMFRNDNDSLPYKERFFTLWISICSFYIQNPNALTFLEQYFSSPFLKCNPSQDKKSFNDEMTRFFEFGMENNYVKKLDFNFLAPVFHGTILSTAKYHISGRFSFNQESLLNVAQIIWDGIKADEN